MAAIENRDRAARACHNRRKTTVLNRKEEPKLLFSFGVSNGHRSRDLLNHNQALYRLSYTHHAHPNRAGASEVSFRFPLLGGYVNTLLHERSEL